MNRTKRTMFYQAVKGLFRFLTFGLLVFAYAQHPDRVIVDNLRDHFQRLNLGDIQIKSYMGQVTLSGEVMSEEAKKEAEKIALSLDGVKKVRSNLRVNPFMRASLSGNEVSGSCKAPNLSGLIEGGARIQLACSGSSIVVSGEVDHAWDEQKILEEVKKLNPGMQVSSSIRVIKPSTDEQIFNAVQSALRENNHQLDGVSFVVEGGVVKFTGRVPNHRVIDAILATTLMVDGVRGVRSEVRIGN